MWLTQCILPGTHGQQAPQCINNMQEGIGHQLWRHTQEMQLSASTPLAVCETTRRTSIPTIPKHTVEGQLVATHNHPRTQPEPRGLCTILRSRDLNPRCGEVRGPPTTPQKSVMGIPTDLNVHHSPHLPAPPRHPSAWSGGGHINHGVPLADATKNGAALTIGRGKVCAWRLPVSLHIAVSPVRAGRSWPGASSTTWA